MRTIETQSQLLSQCLIAAKGVLERAYKECSIPYGQDDILKAGLCIFVQMSRGNWGDLKDQAAESLSKREESATAKVEVPAEPERKITVKQRVTLENLARSKMKMQGKVAENYLKVNLNLLPGQRIDEALSKSASALIGRLIGQN